MIDDFDEVDIIVDDEEASSETVISFSDMVEDELSFEDRDEGEFDIQDDTFHQSKDDSKLQLTAFAYSDYLREYKSDLINQTQLSAMLLKSSEALFELLLSFGSVDALDGLTTLLTDSNSLEDRTVYDFILTGLISFSELEKCPLIEEDYTLESSTQITLELQDQLFSNLFDTFELTKGDLEKLISAFKNNPNFSSDSRLSSL